MGNSAKEIAVALANAGVAAVGADCGDLDQLETDNVISLMKESIDLPRLAQPNAGKPRLFDNRTVFDMVPEAFTNGIVECMRAGASLVGGCCGTTPAHIRSLAGILFSER